MARMIESSPKGPDVSTATREDPPVVTTEVVEETPEETTEETTEQTEAPAKGKKAPKEDQGGDTEESTETEETEEYVPPTTYKVKGQEIEYPEWARALMTDDESTKVLQEHFEKVGGFDHIKADREAAQTNYDQLVERVNQEFVPAVQQVQAANQFLQQGDLASFFALCNIPMENVCKFALHYAQQQPVQRTAIEQNARSNVQAWQGGIQQNNQLTTMQQQLVAAREREVTMVLSNPEITQIASELDTRFGKSGVLRDEMIKRGNYYHAQGQDISAQQALNEVLVLAGYTPGQVMPQAKQGAVPGTRNVPIKTPTGNVVRRTDTKPVIRNVGAGGKSPAKPQIKNLEDLKKRRDQLAAAGR